jgi:nucleotide-binding universal stress UspA family protein
MFHRILIPFDDSARASDAAAMASHLASRIGASLELVYVESSVPGEPDEEAVDRQMSIELTRMSAYGLDAHTHIEFGQPNETVIAACNDLHADLILIAPHRRNLLSRMLPLGITEHLLVHSPVPLLICPDRGQADQGKDHPPNSLELLSGRDALVICPLDGSDVAERALPYAIPLAREFERTVLLVRVVPPLHGFASSPRAYDLLREAQRDEEHAAVHYLHAIRHRLLHEQQGRGVSVETMLLSGDPAAEILGLSKAHETSVVVMSTHGRTGLSRMIIGSVTAEVVHRSNVPVFVMPSALVFEHASRAAVRSEAYAVPDPTANQRATSTGCAE